MKLTKFASIHTARKEAVLSLKSVRVKKIKIVIYSVSYLFKIIAEKNNEWTKWLGFQGVVRFTVPEKTVPQKFYHFHPLLFNEN